MKRSKQKLIHRMEIQDDLGIKRNVKKSLFGINIRLYMIIKIILLACIPVVYFLCSPLLIVAVGLLGLYIIVTVSVEKSCNAGLKKEFHVKLPRLDSILSILLIVIAIAGTIVNNSSVSQKKGMFDGFNQEQIEKIDDMDFDPQEFKKMRSGNKILEFGTLQTGTRYLFKEQKTFGGFGGGQPDFKDMGMEEPPEGFTPPDDFEKPDINGTLSDMPFEMIFKSIIKAVAIGMVALILLSGILSLIKLKKIEKRL